MSNRDSIEMHMHASKCTSAYSLQIEVVKIGIYLSLLVIEAVHFKGTFGQEECFYSKLRSDIVIYLFSLP
jgi:hypothetical protein